MTWTKEQQRAIDERGKNILVSAAAGSGKTAVMVERITRMICDDQIPVDAMLVVTFTRAAAAEMRERIRISLRKAADAAAASGAEAAFLREQLRKLPSAQICTIDAFSQSVIRRFFTLIPEELKEPDFRICDDSERILLRQEAAEELFDDYYEAKDPDFIRFLDTFTNGKNDGAAQDLLFDVYESLMAVPDPWDHLDEACARLRLPDSEYGKTAAPVYYRSLLERELAAAADELERARDELSDASVACVDEPIEHVRNAQAFISSGDLEDAASEIGFKFPSLTNSKAAKEEKAGDPDAYERMKLLRDQAKARLKALHEKWLPAAPEQLFDRREEEADAADIVNRLLKAFDKRFRAKKSGRGLLDFNDCAHLCLEILKHAEAAEYYQNKFKAVFIDEYQDTSLLQEAMLEKVVHGDDLFAVGDIKQSIYRFRQAEPENFRRRYRAYQVEGKKPDARSCAIDFSENFRSKPPVLGTVNRIFRPIMEGYDSAAELRPGVPYAGPYAFEPELDLIEKANAENADPDVARLEDTEREALHCAKLIRENIGKDYLDTKTGNICPLRYGDIVILVRSMTRAYLWESIMKREGIPFTIERSTEFFEQTEIAVFLNLLAVIDNSRQDLEFISVLRSEIFSFSTAELAQVRMEFPDGSYVSAFRRCAGLDGEGPAADAGLRDRCAAVLEKLSFWRTQSQTMPLARFLWTLMNESGYYVLVGVSPDGAARQANLRALIDRAERFGETQESSLYAFNRYLQSLKTRGISGGSTVPSDSGAENTVRLMTMHKSKGLEFPMVIAAGLGSRLKQETAEERIRFHKDLGIGVCFTSHGGKLRENPIEYDLILKKLLDESAEEERRILYVALTRAREKLYLVGTVESAETYLQDAAAGKRSDLSYLKMLKDLPENLRVIRPDELHLTPAGRSAAPPAPVPAAQGTAGKELTERIGQRLSFRYPFEAAERLRSKYSVSELNQAAAAGPGVSRETLPAPGVPEGTSPASRGLAEGSAVESVPEFLQGKKKLTAAEKGTIYHGILQRIDFDRAEAEGKRYLDGAIRSFVDAGIFVPDELAQIDPDDVLAFFETGIGRRCTEAYRNGTLLREQPFNLVKEMEGERIIVQGVIDCCFEEDGGIVLVDYKSGFVDSRKPIGQEKERLRARYATQMELYAEALERGTEKTVAESYLYLVQARTVVPMGPAAPAV